MKFFLVLTLSASLGLFAAAQSRVTAGPATPAAPALSATASPGHHAAEPSADRTPLGLQSGVRSVAPLQGAPASVHRPRHWLRWAILSVAAIVGVIAVIAYKRNEGTTVNQGIP